MATARWSAGGEKSNQSYKENIVKEKLESLVAEMIDRRIYLDEALDEFEKRFIQTALTKRVEIKPRPPRFLASIAIRSIAKSSSTN